jgi:acetolactate synthase-1/2/3 large subunit
MLDVLAKPESATADDTLIQKSKEAGVVSGGHLLAKALKAEAGDTLCGGQVVNIDDGYIDDGIKIVDVRHKQTAAHAADSSARQVGKLGAVVPTPGPGCTNAVTGIATAFRSESPVLHIGGQSELGQWKMGGLQDLPHVDIMMPITKLASTVMSTERVADMISMAAHECSNGVDGPSYLEIPCDVLESRNRYRTRSLDPIDRRGNGRQDRQVGGDQRLGRSQRRCTGN